MALLVTIVFLLVLTNPTPLPIYSFQLNIFQHVILKHQHHTLALNRHIHMSIHGQLYSDGNRFN